MLTAEKIKVGANSEYDQLKKVIIQPPGEEQNLVLPWNGVHPLLDSMPISPEEAKREYEALRGFLNEEIGSENVYTVEDLLTETLTNLEWEDQCKLIEEMSLQAKRTLVASRLGEMTANRDMFVFSSESEKAGYLRYLSDFNARPLAREILQGYPSMPEFDDDGELSDLVFNPKRTLMWVRDCAAITPVGAVISSMSQPRREEEPAVLSAIFKHHPQLGEHTIANRANKAGLEKVTRELFAKDTECKIQQIMHVYLPDLPISIHLDSIFNMIAPQTAVAMPYVFGHPEQPERYYDPVMRKLRQDMLRAGEDPSALPSDNDYKKWGTAKVYTREDLEMADDFESAGKDVRFIDHLVSEGLLDTQNIAWVGGGIGGSWIKPNAREFFQASNEQANLGANVFCTGPFRMIAYDRNNGTLNNIRWQGRKRVESYLARSSLGESLGKIAVMPSRELRGTATWGGPHCMTLPISRETV
jgi:arginine deiminase